MQSAELNMLIARNTDPITSHIAAQQITLSGARGRQQRIALRAVIEHPGLTSRELAALCSLDRYQMARRLPELEEADLVAKGPARQCKAGGRPAVTWLVGRRLS
jgi:DNA-binding MarR family transcriptional regulator